MIAQTPLESHGDSMRGSALTRYSWRGFQLCCLTTELLTPGWLAKTSQPVNLKLAGPKMAFGHFQGRKKGEILAVS